MLRLTTRLAPSGLALLLGLTACDTLSSYDWPRMPWQDPKPTAAPRAEPAAVRDDSPALGADQRPEGVSEEAYQADLDSCWAYAGAEAAHDRRIDDDIAAGRADEDRTLSTRQFNQGMESFNYEQIRREAFGDCMRARGYAL